MIIPSSDSALKDLAEVLVSVRWQFLGTLQLDSCCGMSWLGGVLPGYSCLKTCLFLRQVCQPSYQFCELSDTCVNKFIFCPIQQSRFLLFVTKNLVCMVSLPRFFNCKQQILANCNKTLWLTPNICCSLLIWSLNQCFLNLKEHRNH